LRIINGDLRFHERQEAEEGVQEFRKYRSSSSGVREFRVKKSGSQGERKGLLVEVNNELLASTANAEKILLGGEGRPPGLRPANKRTELTYPGADPTRLSGARIVVGRGSVRCRGIARCLIYDAAPRDRLYP
jgi:hypothetical protein